VKDILGYEGLYAVDRNGTVYSTQQTRSRRLGPLKPEANTAGYYRVALTKNGKQKKFFVHRLVAQAFVPNSRSLPNVNHINADQHDNRADNLEWSSQKDNIAWSRRLGNQSKDIPTRATSLSTGEQKHYVCIKDAQRDLCGDYTCLSWHLRKEGHYDYAGYRFEVLPT
jgi:hypothetical protein